MALLLVATASPAMAREGVVEWLLDQWNVIAVQAPSEQTVEVAFSPDGGSEALIVKVIQTSKQSIRLAAYSFTSPRIVRALLDARRRGVDVRVVVDGENNRSAAGSSALNLLAGGGVALRTNDRYAIHHDKYIVSDARHVQTGSYNYSRAAQESNSENVMVLWNNAPIAEAYLRHWQSRFDEAKPYRPKY